LILGERPIQKSIHDALRLMLLETAGPDKLSAARCAAWCAKAGTIEKALQSTCKPNSVPLPRDDLRRRARGRRPFL
jgi:hypothetical protein